MSRRNTFLDTKTAKIYDDNTLIGNWLENRAVLEKVPPPIQQKDEVKLSEYKTHFGNAPKDNELCDIFTSSYVQGFRNRARAHHSSVKFFNAEQFLSNLTSTTDIFFRIKPGRNMCGRFIHDPIPTPGFDPINSLGNQTNIGLRQYIKEREAKLKAIPPDISYTRDYYKCPRRRDYAKRVKKKRDEKPF